jgi:hypothetical protein
VRGGGAECNYLSDAGPPLPPPAVICAGLRSGRLTHVSLISRQAARCIVQATASQDTYFHLVSSFRGVEWVPSASGSH